MALALWKEGVYVAGMTKELAFPNDLAACHAMLREQALVAVAQDRAITSQESVIKRQHDKIEEQRIEIAKLEKERDIALQLAFRKKIGRYLPDPKQFVLDFDRPRKRPATSSSRPTCRGTRSSSTCPSTKRPVRRTASGR